MYFSIPLHLIFSCNTTIVYRMLAILSLFTWFEIVLCFILFIPFQIVLFLLTAPFDKKRIIMHYHSSLWCTIALALSPLWNLDIQGKQYLDKKKTHIVVMNHQSLLDVLIAFRLFYPVKMISKKALAFVPIVGWNLLLSGHLLVDRKSLKSQMGVLASIENHLNRGESILLFPEGTRTKDGEIHEFKRGTFKAAINTKTDILPIVIDGPYQLLPKKGFIAPGKHTIYIHILPPVPVSEYQNAGDLAEAVRNVMVNELIAIRKVT